MSHHPIARCRRLLKRRAMGVVAVAVATLALCWPAGAEAAGLLDYSRLIGFIELTDREGPLHVFKDYEAGFDASSSTANVEYLNSHPELIKKIRRQVNEAPLHWRLKRMRHRLLFVPETRKAFAVLYENHCRDIVRYVLDKTDSANPFQEILTLDGQKPRELNPSRGVQVFLVHNLAKEFQATNIFSSRKKTAVELKIKGRIFVGDIGSFCSRLEFLETGAVIFSRDPYTIWQNSAENPYTALMTPAEETLHVLLRPYTESAIAAKVSQHPQKDRAAATATANEWIAVEEAVAGAVAHRLAPQFLKRRTSDLRPSLVDADIAARMKWRKYRYLRSGIDLVERLGIKTLMDRYRANPAAIRQLLKSHPS